MGTLGCEAQHAIRTANRRDGDGDAWSASRARPITVINRPDSKAGKARVNALHLPENPTPVSVLN